jgi:hypothetical protein
LRDGQASLRDALDLSRLLPWAKATWLLSSHRYAMRTRNPVSSVL